MENSSIICFILCKISAIPALRELLPGSYPEFWQSQNSGMKGKVATARIELAIPHLEGFFCENYIFNILYYHIFQCVIIQRELLHSRDFFLRDGGFSRRGE